ncbi:hypothetical protein SAY86_008394 [Trapa natans]|uniref:Uncharacterized protein n=1 Tax=Trapa natans TaxID=22666 RepID=A0AAN7K9E3_TRANT|nr:hypothetical protein SAY86_008394 [Trapa natans]
MENEAKSPGAKEAGFILQRGNRKSRRCVVDTSKDHIITPTCANSDPSSRKCLSDSLARRSPDPLGNKRKSFQHSPGKEDRFCATRGSMTTDENGKVLLDHNAEDDKGVVLWPKLFLSLSSKEKENDFMAFRGRKPSRRPKRRAKLTQKSVLLACPGTWLSDLSSERYEVMEKRASKKKRRGLKTMGNK